MSELGSGPVRSPAGSWALFARDVRRTVNLCARDPRLPLTALALAMFERVWFAIGTTTGETAIGLIGVAVALYFVGFSGTERVWFVCVDRGLPSTWSDVRSLTAEFRWRFIRLGVLYLCLLLVPTVVIVSATDSNNVIRSLLFLAVWSALSVTLTFAPIGLAFNDGTARDALRHSVAVLRAQWPQCAWYVLISALGGVLLQLLPRLSLGFFVLLALDIVLAGFVLLCSGATVLFYADRYATLYR